MNVHSLDRAASADGSEAAQCSGSCFEENIPAKGGIRADSGNRSLAGTRKISAVRLM